MNNGHTTCTESKIRGYIAQFCLFNKLRDTIISFSSHAIICIWIASGLKLKEPNDKQICLHGQQSRISGPWWQESRGVLFQPVTSA